MTDDLDDLRDDLEAMTAIVTADDKVAEAMRLLRDERTAHRATRALYETQRVQLAAANKEAARLKKRVAQFERGELK